MAINSVLQAGLQGIDTGMTGIRKSAQTVAAASMPASAASSERVTEALVELKLYEQGVKGSARVVQTADEMMGTLLDTFA